MTKQERLKKARKATRMTQLAVASAAGIEQGQISRMERGESWASNETCKKIAGVLRIPVSDLIDIEGVDGAAPTPIPDNPAAIAADRTLPKGLRDLAADEALIDALDIQALEWRALASMLPPGQINKKGYLTLATTIRSVTKM